MEEIWKDIPDYDGSYQVSNWGQVKSLCYRWGLRKEPLLMNPTIDNVGYLTIGLYKDKKKTWRIHQLVAMAFLGHQPNGYETVINHIDNNPLNNHVNNLEILKKDGGISASRKNSSCHKEDIGVFWRTARQKWQASICIDNKKMYLGMSDNKQDVLDIYQKALANQHLYNGDAKAFRLALTTVTL